MPSLSYNSTLGTIIAEFDPKQVSLAMIQDFESRIDRIQQILVLRNFASANAHLDLESSFEAAGEEASEGSDDRREDGHEEGVQQERVQRHRLLHAELQNDRTAASRRLGALGNAGT